ncbi:MAG: NAD-glutamate dehydrogenase [Trueperaceae bacterium]|nr:NAD-glutamate dehydrogenase [Trueperaceae bacterium]
MPASLEQVKRRIALSKTKLSKTKSSKTKPDLAQFADLLYGKANKEFMASFDTETLFAIAVSAFRFLQQGNSDLSLRVYNPEYQTEGWETSYTIIELRLKDRPFIVDSVRAAIARSGYELYHLLHPIIAIRRDEEGLLESFALEGESSEREAYELYFIDRIYDEEERAQLETRIRSVLTDVILATKDYSAMRHQLENLGQYLHNLYNLALRKKQEDRAEAFVEYASFLNWLDEDNFVFLGYREYEIVSLDLSLHLQVVSDSGLGILSKSGSNYDKPVALADLPEELRERVQGGRTLMVSKTNAESTVHRPVRMDYIGVKKLGENWSVIGEQRFIGLFTSKALATPVQHIPLLRLKLRQVLALDKAVPGSHDYKQITTIFNSMPRDGLFWAEVEQLHRDIRTIMSLEQERGVRLSIRPDPLGRGLSAMVMMSRDRFNAEVRRDIQSYLQNALEASHVDYQLAMGQDESQTRLHFFFMTQKSQFDLDLIRLERDIAEFTRTWDDHLEDLLVASLGEVRAKQLLNKYLSAFDDSYRAEVGFATAPKDIEKFEALKQKEYLVDLINPLDEDEPVTQIRIYHQLKRLVLSEVMPLLENLGFIVLEQNAYSLTPLGLAMDVFSVTDGQGKQLDLRSHGERLIEAIHALLYHEAENDPLNQLVLATNLNIRQVFMILAYRMYYVQLNATASRDFVSQTLLNYPEMAELLYAAFAAKFNPNFDGDRLAALEQIKSDYDEALKAVPSLVEDTLLRRLFNLIEVSLRSNFYLNKPVISFKLESQRVSSMPSPRPLYEIGVYGLDVEGTHLRGGKVARGGIRWSDRPDDFRTEVLGLMKTQMTKNAVIVPVGSKGGFIIKNAPRDRSLLKAYVETQYRSFISSLLDITDNIVGGVSVHPKELIVYDDFDPYLVVAADKGTATFSDLANSISAEYGFWLGDAFASGGSQGYDHKKEGITARGAWECVKRHFAEMKLDVMQDEFTAFGIGDMSGDVFGNGMLYTPKLKLLAAFNHLHIFLDPRPNAQLSFEERQRLFKLSRSSWTDYNESLISQGGGVFERTAKAIELSPEVQEMLGLTVKTLSGQELIRAILKMKVDLFWNGGIGTYVKASSEDHEDVGDSSNDAVRIDAPELQARVVGEGGNLGFTQLARIEYALAGGRINTDAIDNSAGVDMSDHEVNIKIMLQPLLSSGELSEVQRNRLLEQMTDEVSELVLADNYSQSLALALAEAQSRQDLNPFSELMDTLSKEGGLNQQVEFLPNRETLEARQEKELGLTRPELAILLAYSKMHTYAQLLASDLPDKSAYSRFLLHYFPQVLQKQYAATIQAHSLRREIIATQMTNTLTDLLGIAYLNQLQRIGSASFSRVVEISLDSLERFGFYDLIDHLAASDLSQENRYQILLKLRQVVSDLSLYRLSHDLTIDHRDLAQFQAKLKLLLPKREQKHYEKTTSQWLKQGVSADLAKQLVAFDYLVSSLGLFSLKQDLNASLETVAEVFYSIGESLQLGWWRDGLKELAATTHDKWEKRALQNQTAAFRKLQDDLSRLKISQPDVWQEKEGGLELYQQDLGEIRTGKQLTLASAEVMLRSLQQHFLTT